MSTATLRDLGALFSASIEEKRLDLMVQIRELRASGDDAVS